MKWVMRPEGASPILTPTQAAEGPELGQEENERHLWLEDHGKDVAGVCKAGCSGVGLFNCHIGTIKIHKKDQKHCAKEQQHQRTAAARSSFQQQLMQCNGGPSRRYTSMFMLEDVHAMKHFMRKTATQCSIVYDIAQTAMWAIWMQQ
eukprot:1157962-Pelagomonas_calceolata.AAC.1